MGAAALQSNSNEETPLLQLLVLVLKKDGGRKGQVVVATDGIRGAMYQVGKRQPARTHVD